MLGWGGTALQKDSVGALKDSGRGDRENRAGPGKEASEKGSCLNGSVFLLFSLQISTSNVNKAEDAGGTRPLSAVSHEAILS